MGKDLDTLDKQILYTLLKERPISNAEIAARIGSSEATVRRRIQHMLDGGVLEFLAVADPEKLGLTIQVVIGVDVNLTQVHEAAQALGTMPQIQFLAYVTGRYDLIMTAFFSSEEELFAFLTDELPNIPGILHIETLRVMKMIKRAWHFAPQDLTGDRVLEKGNPGAQNNFHASDR